MRTETAEKVLIWLLRINGALAMLATVAVVAPTSWLDAGSRASGLGAFPDTPLIQYLARSVSAIYALLGALLLYIACDVRRHLELIRFVGWLTIVLGAVLTVLDFAVGMPAAWSWGEGPPTMAVGAAFVWLVRVAGAGGP